MLSSAPGTQAGYQARIEKSSRRQSDVLPAVRWWDSAPLARKANTGYVASSPSTTAGHSPWGRNLRNPQLNLSSETFKTILPAARSGDIGMRVQRAFSAQGEHR
ncbi:hypothetical protein AcV5_000241 [Taiwanofungus camphoratus]|nr:hypothetical protein AcV5_000241 [Antrodia cinnamomea]